MSYLGKTTAASVFMTFTLLAGCGDFEWFPKDNGFGNYSSSSVVTKPGTVMRELPYPAGVNWVSDVFYDKNSASFWLLAWTGLAAPPNVANALVNINAITGAYISKIDNDGWPFTILDGSTLVFDGQFFLITSHGPSSGVAANELYQVRQDGSYRAAYPCLATSSEFCQGLAFDSTTSSYWSAGSDNTTLVNFQIANGAVTSAFPYANIWTTPGVSDVAFDSATNDVFVVKNGIIRVNKNNGAFLGSIPFTLPGTGRGDWDGTYLWVVDNGTRSIKALFVR